MITAPEQLLQFTPTHICKYYHIGKSQYPLQENDDQMANIAYHTEQKLGKAVSRQDPGSCEPS
jgi:hypothetical protein